MYLLKCTALIDLLPVCCIVVDVVAACPNSAVRQAAPNGVQPHHLQAESVNKDVGFT